MLTDLSGLEQTLQCETSVEIKWSEQGVDISAITNQQLVVYLFSHQAVFPCPRSDEDILSVE
jgi:hypothetical protein